MSYQQNYALTKVTINGKISAAYSTYLYIVRSVLDERGSYNNNVIVLFSYKGKTYMAVR